VERYVDQKERIRVLIVDDVAETRENLRKLLSFDPDIEVVGSASTGEQGIQLAKELQPHVVLMDINLPGMDGITATEHIVREVPTAQIVILSVQGESGYMRRAMAAGARDFLVKPPSSDELVNAIRRAYEISKTQAMLITTPQMLVEVGGQKRLRPRGAPRRNGRLVTVFAPKGGVGCTTVAVNLAIALHEALAPERKAALMDASLQFGDVGVMLNLQSSRSIADLSGRLEDLDSDMLTSAMTAHPSGIKVLLAPPHPEAAEALRASETGSPDGGGLARRLRAITNNLLAEFDLVVADTASLLDDVTLTLLDASVVVLVVITPLIPAIKSARMFLDVAYQMGYPPDKIGLVINEADRRTGLRVDQIEKALVPAIAHIPYDERAGLSAANRGIPMMVEERGKPIGQAFVQLARNVMERIERLSPAEEEAIEDESAEASRRLLGRIMG